MDLITGAIVGGITWVGVLAKNYYTEMAKLAVERSKDDRANEQRRIEKQEKYFEILFQHILLVVGEEKDRQLMLQQQILEVSKQVIESLEKVKRSVDALNSKPWDGVDRRK